MSDTKGYVAPVNCNVFIGSILLDDTAVIEYSVSNHIEVYYGYNSKYYDAIADGRRLVIGALTLNFRAISYLTRAITMARAGDIANLNPEAILTQDNSRLRLNYDLDGIEDSIIEAVVGSINSTDGQRFMTMKESLQEEARPWFYKKDKDAPVNREGPSYASTPENPITMEGLEPVDLIIKYDNIEQDDPERIEILRGVKFRGMGKRIDNSRADMSAAPVFERYEFVCRKVEPYAK